MKSAGKLIIFVLTTLTLAASAYAQSPREQLNQMVQQLRISPNDTVLRERIVRLAAQIEPAPAIPEEANRSFVRGNVFQKEAKDPSGYALAISAYREALRIAPWWSDAYFNLAVAEESASKFDDAVASLKLFIASVPAASVEAREAQNRIYALEVKSEMATRALVAPRAPNLARLQGTWVQPFGEGVAYNRLLVEGDTIKILGYQYVTPREGTVSLTPGFWGEYRLKAENGEFTGVYVEGTQFKACAGREKPAHATLSADGMELTVTGTGSFGDGQKWDPRGFMTGDTNSCAYDSGAIGRFVIRKQP